jgi:hypothetical protein
VYPDKLLYQTKGDISAITPNISKSIVEEVEVKIGVKYVNRLLDLYFKTKRQSGYRRLFL